MTGMMTISTKYGVHYDLVVELNTGSKLSSATKIYFTVDNVTSVL